MTPHILPIIQWHIRSTGSTRWRSWLRHCPTNRRSWFLFAMGSLIFYWRNPSSRTMTLWSTLPLTELSSRIISLGKWGWCLALTTLPPSCTDCLESLGAQLHEAIEVCLDLYIDWFITKPILFHNKICSYFQLLFKQIPTRVPHRRLSILPFRKEYLYLYLCVCVCVCVCVWCVQ